MKIAVASGKGGTGKTTVSTNLACALAGEGMRVTYADCDVEEPNGHLFIKPEIIDKRIIGVPTPRVELEKCTMCGKCQQVCQYNAIIPMGKEVLVFDELCHACGGCMLVCPEKAISEVDRPIGELERGSGCGVDFIHGRMKLGQVLSPFMIKEVKNLLPQDGLSLIDSPPGTTCPTVESVRDSDYVVMVTEPTAFGLHDLKLAVDVMKELGLKFGVVINRDGMGDERTEEYCRDNDIRLLSKIPNSRSIAEAYSKGEMLVDTVPEYRQWMLDLWAAIKDHAGIGGTL